jgi:hypothetical protein
MARGSLKLRTIVGGAAMLILVGTIMLCIYGWWLQHEATSLLTDLTSLRVGSSSAQDAERFAQRHREFLTNRDCKNTKCEYSFTVQNRWLSSLHFEPTAQFLTGMTVENGTVTHIDAFLLRTMDIYPSFGASAGMVDEYNELPERYAQRGHYFFPTPIGKPYLRVVLDRHADAVQRQHAFAFSFECLTRPGGGCDLSCDYLPLAWRDWRADTAASGFPMGDFDQVYQNDTRCK